MRVGTLLGIAVGLMACAESTAPVAPLRVFDQSPALAAETEAATHITQPFSTSLPISCANGGVGETVALSGEVEIVSHSTTDANGGVHLSMHVRPAAVTGVGATTGLKYRGTGGGLVSQFDAADGFPAVYTMINNFRIIGQGPGNNVLMHMTIHVTMNANGEQTAQVDLSSQDCK